MTPAELSAAYLSILTGIVERRGASDTVTVEESHAALERPKNRAHGDWASNAAMQLAKRLGTNPRELATEIAGELTELDGVASVDVAGPGSSTSRSTRPPPARSPRPSSTRAPRSGRATCTTG